MAQGFPLRWPAEWRHPSALEVVKGTPIEYLVMDPAEELKEVAAEARKAGFTVCSEKDLPQGVMVARGEWPGVRMGQRRGEASGGPTGVPWVDSNGWLIQLSRARNPGKSVWIATEPPKPNEIKRVDSYRLALADAAASGGRWILDFDPDMRKALDERNPAAVESWKKIVGTMEFFRRHAAWGSWRNYAILGVVSDFAEANEFLGQEFLNLTARLNQPYVILEKNKLTAADMNGLKAVVYPDGQTPSPELRRMLSGFVEKGGLLVAGPEWGAVDGKPYRGEENPRYAQHSIGKGRIAIATDGMSDPYMLAADAQLLMSHRNDLIRFWNGGAMGSNLTQSADGSRRMLHLVNYTTRPTREPITAGVAGDYRAAECWLLEASSATPLQLFRAKDGIELHLPPVPLYAAIELTLG